MQSCAFIRHVVKVNPVNPIIDSLLGWSSAESWRHVQSSEALRHAFCIPERHVFFSRGSSRVDALDRMAPRESLLADASLSVALADGGASALWNLDDQRLGEGSTMLAETAEAEFGMVVRSQRKELRSVPDLEPPALLVFSGGTAFNGVVEDLKHYTTRVSHVLPVSDDGGSTAEIVRVLGGPAVGDIRSRCLRLSDGSNAEALAVKRLLGHRLPMDPTAAKLDWYSIVEGEHELWEGVSAPYKDTIRAFLVHFQGQILRHSTQRFCFQNGSVGNYFFAGARTFFRSMEAAIFLYSRVSQISAHSLVLPVVCTNNRLTLGAELQDGTVIRGQHEISHPSLEPSTFASRTVNKMLPSPPLPSPIKRVFYMSAEGTHLLHEVFPDVNPRVLDQLTAVDGVIYGMGSLYTSICPCLVLRGIGEAIAARDCPKVLLLNGAHDRETAGMTAADFVSAICEALNRTHGENEANRLQNPASSYVSVLLSPRDGQVPIDRDRLLALGITNVVIVDSEPAEQGGALFSPTALIKALESVVQPSSRRGQET